MIVNTFSKESKSMNRQNATKDIIAYSFKYLARENEIDKISITDIMDQTDFRRQTFYDHFDDKYDLITWIFSYETSKLIQSLTVWEKWQEGLLYLLNYLEENSNYYKKVFSNMKFDSFKEYFAYYIRKIVKKVVNDYFRIHVISNKNQAIIETTADFYAYGLSEMLYRWVLGGCELNSEMYHKIIIQVIGYRTQP